MCHLPTPGAPGRPNYEYRAGEPHLAGVTAEISAPKQTGKRITRPLNNNSIVQYNNKYGYCYFRHKGHTQSDVSGHNGGKCSRVMRRCVPEKPWQNTTPQSSQPRGPPTQNTAHPYSLQQMVFTLSANSCGGLLWCIWGLDLLGANAHLSYLPAVQDIPTSGRCQESAREAR